MHVSALPCLVWPCPAHPSLTHPLKWLNSLTVVFVIVVMLLLLFLLSLQLQVVLSNIQMSLFFILLLLLFSLYLACFTCRLFQGASSATPRVSGASSFL